MFNSIFSLTFFVLAALAALLGFLRAKKAKWQLCSMRLATNIIAGAAAVLMAVAAARELSGIALDIALEFLPADVCELFAARSVADSAEAIVAMILAPLLYLLLFAIIKPLLAIANKPIAILLVDLFEKKDKAQESTAAQSSDESDDTPSAPTDTASAEYESPFEYQLSSDPPSPAQTEDGEKSYSDPVKQYNAEKKQKLRNDRITLPSSLIGAVSGFVLFYLISFPSVCGLALIGEVADSAAANVDFEYSELVRDAANGASNNAGATMMKFTGGAAAYRYMTSYDVSGHKATLENELDFISDAVCVAFSVSQDSKNYDGAKAEGALSDAADSFENTTIIPSILAEFLKNATEAWESGEDYMGISKLSLGENMEKVSDTLLDILSNENFDTIKEDVPAIFRLLGTVISDTHPADIKDAPLELVKDQQLTTEIFEAIYSSDRLYKLIPAFSECGIQLICDTLEIRDDLEPLYDEMMAELDSRFAEYEGSRASAQDSPHALVSDITNALGNYGIEISENTAAYLAERVANGESITRTLRNNEIEVLDVKGNASRIVLKDATTFAAHTQLLPVSIVKINDTKPADVKAEAAALARIIATALDLADKLDGKDLAINDIAVDLGGLLDSLDRTHTFGHDSTQNLLICILQSDKIYTQTKLSVVAMTDIIYQICESAQTDSYALQLQNLSRTIDIITAVSSGDRADEAIRDLIVDLTPATSETIQQIATPSTMISYGVPEQSAQASADIISNVFQGLSDAKTNETISEEEYEEEAQAISDLLTIAVNAANNSTADSAFGENSATGISAQDFIESLTASDIVGQTIIDTVYDDNGNVTLDPLNTNIKVPEKEVAELISAANDILAESSPEEISKTQQQLIAAAALINVNVQIIDGEIVRVPSSNN